MKAAVKVGPKGWQKVFDQTKAKYCEIWFRLDWQDKYIPLFKYLNKNKINFGLHFWAMVKGKYLPNMLYLDKNIAEETYRLIKETIDIASQWGAKYVNFHPESYRLGLLDLDKETFEVLDPDKPFDKEKSFEQLVFYLKKIKQYAKKKKVAALIETVPKYAPSDFKNLQKGRLKPQLTEGLETEKFFTLVKMGFPICLDFEHTMSQYITDDRKKLFNYIMKVTRKLSPGVGLIHVTTKLPPYIGTDSHNGILEEDFKKPGVIPNKQELIQLLSLFKDKDIWIIPEPYQEMIENHLALKKIVREVEKEPRN